MEQFGTGQTQTHSYREELQGGPEQVDEWMLWGREGLASRETLEHWSHYMRMGNYIDVADFAMQGLLSTPYSAKALHDAEAKRQLQSSRHLSDSERALASIALEQKVTPYHLFDEMEIFRKELFVKDGRVKSVQPGQTPQEFIDKGGDAQLLRNSNLWVVSIDSLQQVHSYLETHVGEYVIDGDFQRAPLYNFGYDEMRTLAMAAMLGGVKRRQYASRHEVA